MPEHCMRVALSRTEDGYLWGRMCWGCHEWVVRPAYETREDVPEVPRGSRQGQLRFYLSASAREYRLHGLRRGLRRLWVARWFWSAGRIGVVPVGYSRHYWDRAAPPRFEVDRKDTDG